MIESYTFGKMVVNGTAYNKDLMILPDGTVIDSWWREDGHGLAMSDLKQLLDTNPEIIIVGTGRSGMMVPDPTLSTKLDEKDIELITVPTEQAANMFNELNGSRKTAAGFHLTC